MRSDGRQFPAELSIARVDHCDPPIYTGFIRDLTERRRAEQARESLQQQLREPQKLQAIGTLAGGIAHDSPELLRCLEPGKGSRFELYLPAASAAAAPPARAAAHCADSAVGRGERVLYIDEALMELFVRLLDRKGFRATGFTDAGRALEELPRQLTLLTRWAAKLSA